MATSTSRPARHRRRLLAAAASAVVPGAGQLATGRRGRGTVLLLLSAALLGTVVWLSTWRTTRLLGTLVRPEVLVGVFVANLLVAGLRVYATVDAYRGSGARRPRAPRRRAEQRRSGQGRRALATTVLGLLLAVVVVPHAAAGYYTVRTHQLLTTVFDTTPMPPTAPVASGPPGGSTAPPPSTGTDGATTPPPDPDGTTDTGAASPWGEGRITVALVGSDAGPDRWSGRTDTMIVASLDPATGALVMISVPRNLSDFPMPPALADVHAASCPTSDGWQLLNALYTCATEQAPEAFAALYPDEADPGLAALRATLAELLGIEVPYHAMVDMTGFVRLIDVLGGVDVEVAEPMRIRMSTSIPGAPWRTFELAPGLQRLSGEEALAFVRNRTGTDDYDRMRRQRCLVGSVVDSADPLSLLRELPAIADIVGESVTTNIPLQALPELVVAGAGLDRGAVTSLGLTPPRFQRADRSPQLEEIREAVVAALQPSTDAPAGGGSPLDLAC